jgi:biotin carboxyl carrier protein
VAPVKVAMRLGEREFVVTITRDDARYHVEVDGARHEVDARKLEGPFYSLLVDGRSYEVSVENGKSHYLVRHGAAGQQVALVDPGQRGRELRRRHDGPETISASMPGKVVRLLVEPGATVTQGQGLLVLEAMKMENEITAPRDGKIVSIEVDAGRTVEAGETLLTLE